ncbi:MAG: hypothetical protein U1A04_10855 [Moraxellaceae bacterium]|nr:hypothetical protein [Moraxellaceae bacterium]
MSTAKKSSFGSLPSRLNQKAQHCFYAAFIAVSIALPITASAMTASELQNLVKLFECQSGVNYELLDATMDKYGISYSAEPYRLKTPLTVFGLPVQTITIFRESGEDAYRAFTQGVTQPQMILAARLKKGQWGFARNTKAGVVRVENNNGLHFECAAAMSSEY